MTEKTAVVNYTEEQVTMLVEGYKAGTSVEDLAVQVGKTVKSVVAKLSREGVYKAKAKATGKGATTKADLVAKLAVELDLDPKALQSLDKATKEALEALVAKVCFTTFSA